MERAPWDLVGRDPERRRIAAAIASDRPVAVAGEAGIGKSSLLRAVALASGVPTWTGGGFATLVGQPYLALGQAIGMPLAGDVAQVAANVERRVGPDLLIIEDLQWVDRPSLDVLALLAGRIQVLASIRTGDPRSATALGLARRWHMEVIELGGLGVEDARVIVRRLRPDLGAGPVDAVVARAGGNPLVLEEIAAHGEPSGVLARVIETSLDLLAPEERAVVELLAVADRPIERDRLPIAAIAMPESGPLVELDGTITIRHALLAETIRTRMGAATMARCHEQLATIVDDPLEQARHLAAAGAPERAIDLAERTVRETTDPRRRAALLTIIAESTDPATGAIPRILAAQAMAALSDWETVIRLLEPLGSDVPGATGVERAALLGHAYYGLGRHAEARAALDAGRGIAVDPASEAAAHLAIESAALMVNLDGAIASALALLDRAIGHHRSPDPAGAMLQAIRASIAMLAAEPVDIDFLRAAVDGALSVGAYSSAADLARVVHYSLLIWSGADPALRYIAEMAARFESVGVSAVALELEAERVQACILAGRPTEAIEAADELLERPAPSRARQTAAIHRARALAIVGRSDEGTASLVAIGDAVTDDFIGRGEWLAALADVELWSGLPERAVATAMAVSALPSPIVNAYVQSHITRAWALCDLGSAQEPLPTVAPTRVAAGAIPELTGLASLVAAQPAAAVAAFDEAAALWVGFDAIRALTCRWAAGEALRQAGDTETLPDRLGGVLADALAADVEVVAVRVRRSMRQAGLRPAPDSTAGPRAGLRLTTRERELLDLAGRGLTNIEIARRMGLGRPTVARILSNAMSKLGAESRAQAVAMVAAD